MLQSLRSLAGQRTLTSRQLPYRVRAFAAALLVLVSGSCDKCITVPEDPVLTTISVSLSATSIQVGQTVTASATGLDQNEASIATGAVTWATSPDAIANVSAGGTVTGTAPGTVAIIASAGGKQGQQTLTVTAAPAPLASLSGKILFSRHGYTGPLGYASWGLLAMGSDGRDPTLITTDLSRGVSMTPTGSSDGQSVAYLDGDVSIPGQPVYATVRVVRADGTGVYDLWPTSGYLDMPSFSRDGRRVAARGEVSAAVDEVVVLDSDGANLRRLFTCVFGFCTGLKLSPQAWWPGDTHVFVSYTRQGSQWSEIFAISVADGSSQLMFSGNGEAGVWDPSVAVDGWVAFTSDFDGHPDIWVSSPTGVPVNLTQSSFADSDPVWSGDGSRLAFVSMRDGNAEIYVINRDGSGLTRLTNNSVEDADPHWVP